LFAPTGEVCNAGSRMGAKKKGEEAVMREERRGREREREKHQETKVGREDVGSGEGEKRSESEEGAGMKP